ncbi:hypothetical protein Tco_0515339 [Tanacetum coccineum]
MQKWSIQLGEFGIHYRPRISVKGQVLADFIVERPKEEGEKSKGVDVRYALRFQFEATNNEAEYKLDRGLRHDQILREGKSTGQYLPSVLNKASPKKLEQKSGCTKQNDIHQLRTSQQTGVGGGIERKIHERKRGARRGRGRRGFLDDPDS